MTAASTLTGTVSGQALLTNHGWFIGTITVGPLRTRWQAGAFTTRWRAHGAGTRWQLGTTETRWEDEGTESERRWHIGALTKG
jgi:hypothetical protein